MGADERAERALHALVGIPLRNIDRYTAFFVGGSAHRYYSVGSEKRYGQRIAIQSHAWTCYAADELRNGRLVDRMIFLLRPCGGIIDLFYRCRSVVDGSHVGLDHGIALMAVGCTDKLAELRDSLVVVDHAAQTQIYGGHYGVDSRSESVGGCDGSGVDGIEFQPSAGYGSFHGCRNSGFHILHRHGGVEHERAAVSDLVEQLEPAYIGVFVASDIVGALDCVCGSDRVWGDP